MRQVVGAALSLRYCWLLLERKLVFGFGLRCSNCKNMAKYLSLKIEGVGSYAKIITKQNDLLQVMVV